MLTLIATIAEFKSEWRALGNHEPENMRTLRRIATIQSAGSSTRIEGAKLSDGGVEQLVGRLGRNFQSRDEQEVAGYAYVMETIQTMWADLRISESILLQRSIVTSCVTATRTNAIVASGRTSKTTSRHSMRRECRSVSCSRRQVRSRHRC